MENNFLAKISHEIRTPLNAIIGFGYLCQQTRLDDQQRKYITTMIDSAKGLLDVFQEMLDFSKLENDDFVINNLPFRLDAVLNDVVATIEPRCHEKGLSFNSIVDDKLPPVLEGDAMRISLILLNLAGNAVKFTERGSITIKVDKLETSPPSISFSIIDTGIGISENMREQIFLPFTQVDSSGTREHHGVGLGLAICSLLIQRMGGTISLEVNPDGGSIFNVTLPLIEAETLPVEKERPLNDVKILIVENNSLNQQLMESQLTALGMKVYVAHEGELALRIISDADIAEKPFDIVILALQLPDIGGVEVAQYIQQSNINHIPALILQSEFCLHEIEQMAKDAGIIDIMPVDASPQMWEEKLVEALEKHIATAPPAQTSESEEFEGTPRILLVEDNEINQEIAYEVLTTAQLEVDIANNGQEAVDAVSKQKYALVLMDVQMPIMDGLEATRRIREAGYTMPIIAMTAHAMLDDKEASMSAGMNAHLTKPLEPMALFAAINSWLPSKSSSKKSSAAPKETPVTRKGKLPDRIEGFNIIGGLATVGGNEDLYANLLKKFANRYATINEDISSCLQKNDIESAVRHAHTVRGIAANLGAEELASAASNLEKSLIHSPSMTTPHLRTLVVCLSNAVNAIKECLDDMEANVNGSNTVAIHERLNQAEREHARYVLEQAITHMEKDWGYAIDVSKHLVARLADTELEQQLKQLVQAVEDFEVEFALDLSKQIQTKLGGT